MNLEDQVWELIARYEQEPHIQVALAELRETILRNFPEATFSVTHGIEPPAIHLNPIVDVEDLDQVTAVVQERLLTMQVEEGLSIHVMPAWPVERVRAHLEQRRHLTSVAE